MKGDSPREHACPTCKVSVGTFCVTMPADIEESGSLLGSHMARMQLAWEVTDAAQHRGRYAR